MNGLGTSRGNIFHSEFDIYNLAFQSAAKALTSVTTVYPYYAQMIYENI